MATVTRSGNSADALVATVRPGRCSPVQGLDPIEAHYERFHDWNNSLAAGPLIQERVSHGKDIITSITLHSLEIIVMTNTPSERKRAHLKATLFVGLTDAQLYETTFTGFCNQEVCFYQTLHQR